VIVVVIWKVLADIQGFAHVMNCELFGNPSCKNCTNVDSVVHDFMGRTVTDL
jgi:hypothetical protein